MCYVFFRCLAKQQIKDAFAEVVQVSSLRNLEEFVLREVDVRRGMLECLDEPRTEVDELEVREGCVADHLGEVKVAVAEVGVVCVHEGVRDLDDVPEDQLHVIIWHFFLQRAKILLLDNAV